MVHVATHPIGNAARHWKIGRYREADENLYRAQSSIYAQEIVELVLATLVSPRTPVQGILERGRAINLARGLERC